METEREIRAATPTTHDAAAEVRRVAAPVAAAPVPLQVGHAEDVAETEADRMADTALRRLAGSEAAVAPVADQHQHGPGCEHVRRRMGGSGGAVVGREGGALDADTSGEINSHRGGGRQMESGVLDRMQTAFGRDFSGVRIHDDAPAARLNRMVSARAFTTGRDVFFGAGEYQPGTAAGERVLAHELAHTVQQESTVSRLVQRKASKVQDNVAALESIERTLRLLRDHRFGSADRERARIPRSGMFGSRTAPHSKMGLAEMERAKEAAKKVGKTLAKKGTPATDVAKLLAQSAGAVYDEFAAAQGAVDQQYEGDLARIGAKAVEALAVGLTPEVLAAEPQVQEIFGKGAAEHQDMIASGKGRLNELIESGEIESSGFHGTSSPILAGLASGGGELLSMKQLASKNIAQTTGEGDTLSGAAGLKDDISIGMGEAGLGTSAVYAALGMKVTHYNATLYTYDELVEEIRKLKILKDLAAFKLEKLDIPAMQQAANDLGVPVGLLTGMIQRITPGKDGSAASLHKRLTDELKTRRKFPKGSPRREGGEHNATTYPILFEFGIEKVTSQEYADGKATSGGTVGANTSGTLPGEGVVKGRIPLGTTLKRAWCPAANVKTLKAELKKMFPGLDAEVLPLEALQALPRGEGRGGEVLWSTFKKMKGEAANMETARDLLAASQQNP
ncbi:hypothetical protein GCM10023340_43800 [Nocardioides marinquilinus]|uniref:eCIS core domain-containing protein n=1 Tax=Nocardioides marinquilinus TaxID=1210400 RepID=A0ABP9Q3M3_9ACTN